jgi:hypothetical protein
MSTIKSSAEHLTLNADGASKDIKFQANGVEKASISSAGAFTSTTIDATALTGDLPAISGANLTGVGVDGISSSADATAMTITSDEQVGIGVTDPDSTLEVSNNTSTYTTHIASTKNATGDNALAITTYDENASNTSYMIRCTTNTNVAGAGTDRFAVMSDGRGLSQFTAKAWGRVSMSNMSLADSHNVSSVTDVSTGRAGINFTNAMANANYSTPTSATEGYMSATKSHATGSFTINHTDTNGNLADANNASFVVFGD